MHQQWRYVSFTPCALQHDLLFSLLILAFLAEVGINIQVTLISISLVTRDVQHFLKCFSAIRASSFENSLFKFNYQLQRFPNVILGPFMYTIISPANKDTLTSLPQQFMSEDLHQLSYCSCYYFKYLLNSYGESAQLCHVPDFSGTIFELI